jgi:similar to stage IV sporulation protein
VLINNNRSDKKKTSIYAKRDGLIKKIIVYRGSKIKEINDYVKKGDILISGNILKDDKIVSKVKSEGIIYAETWYKAKINIPFKYVKREYTGKKINHYYLDINGFKFTIMGKYDSKDTINETKLILSKPYLFFDLYKEEKQIYKNVTHNINEKEALELAINAATDKIKKSLNKDEYIISKNVLKKEVNSSKMYVEVFFKIYENIGYTSSIDKLGEEDASSN